MTIVDKKHLAKYPKGTVFAECDGGAILSDIMIKDGGSFGAVNVVPKAPSGCIDYCYPDDAEYSYWDWDLEADYDDNDNFVVFEPREVMMMINALTQALLGKSGEDFGGDF